MFLIICLHGSRRADFSLFFPLYILRTRHDRSCPPSHKCSRRFPRFYRREFADDRPYCLPPAVARRTKRKSGVTTPEFPLDHTPLSRRCTALRAMPRRPSGRCEGSFPQLALSGRARKGRARCVVIIADSSSESRARPKAPWAACRRTWSRTPRCCRHPLSTAPCPR